MTKLDVLPMPIEPRGKSAGDEEERGGEARAHFSRFYGESQQQQPQGPLVTYYSNMQQHHQLGNLVQASTMLAPQQMMQYPPSQQQVMGYQPSQHQNQTSMQSQYGLPVFHHVPVSTPGTLSFLQARPPAPLIHSRGSLSDFDGHFARTSIDSPSGFPSLLSVQDEAPAPGGRVRSTLQMTNFLATQMRHYNFFNGPKGKDERQALRRNWEAARREFNEKFGIKVTMTAYRRKVSHLRRTTASRQANKAAHHDIKHETGQAMEPKKKYRMSGSEGGDEQFDADDLGEDESSFNPSDDNDDDVGGEVKTPPPMERIKSTKN